MTTSIRSNDKLKSFLKLPVPIKPTPMAKPFPKPVANPPKLDGYKSIAAGTVSGYAERADIVRDERTYKYKRILEKNGKVIKEKEWVEDIPRLW